MQKSPAAPLAAPRTTRVARSPSRRRQQLPYLLMLLPGLVFILIFNYGPLLGSVIAFQDFNPGKGLLGSTWVGFQNFARMFTLPDSGEILRNTLLLAVAKLVLSLVAALAFAVLLNELRQMVFKRVIQTLVYLPHFLSWVILASIARDLFALNGPINSVVQVFGGQPIYFLGDNSAFPALLIGSDVWKEYGFGAIVFLAALTAISPSLYEAAEMDGATRWQRIRYITLPSLVPTMVLLGCLSLGNVLNAGFDQIFNLYSPLVYPSSDVVDTWVYRTGLLDAQYGLSSAVGLLKSVVSFVMISLAYWLAFRFAKYRIF